MSHIYAMVYASRPVNLVDVCARNTNTCRSVTSTELQHVYTNIIIKL